MVTRTLNFLILLSTMCRFVTWVNQFTSDETPRQRGGDNNRSTLFSRCQQQQIVRGGADQSYASCPALQGRVVVLPQQEALGALGALAPDPACLAWLCPMHACALAGYIRGGDKGAYWYLLAGCGTAPLLPCLGLRCRHSEAGALAAPLSARTRLGDSNASQGKHLDVRKLGLGSPSCPRPRAPREAGSLHTSEITQTIKTRNNFN